MSPATNLQGDVTAILATNGTAVVKYTYDAWGKLLSTTGSMADTLGELNPLRYRGYIYDGETGLYYLQSRYYDPELGRFISADSYASTGQGLLGNNMFAYCLNNPLCYSDPSGNVALNIFYSVAHDGLDGCSNQEKPIVQRILEHITATDESNITFSAGLTGAVSGYGPGIGSTFGVAVDSSYNYAGFNSKNYGVGSSLGVSAMGGINFQVTNADVVTDLDGVSKSYGFSAACGVGIAVDVVQFIPASNPNTTSWGVSITIGLGIGFDVHAWQSNTTVSEIWNPWKDLCDRLFGG